MRKNYLAIFLIVFAPICVAQNQGYPASLSEEIEAIVNKADYYNFSGIVFVSVDGEVISNIGVGKSDIGSAIPFSSKTVLDIGSITKQFTAAAILKLEMLGKLSTEDEAGRYVPSLEGALNRITIHELLSHTSGMTGETGDDYEPITSVDLVTRLNGMQLTYARETYHYSNLGYSLLALIVENVSGKPLDEFLAMEFFNPIGMSKTGYTYPDYKDKEVSLGYLHGEEWGYPHRKNWSKTGPYWNLRGNGGMLSTAEDMYKWHNALLTDQYLSGIAKEKLFGMHVREYPDVESYYGYGWVTEILPNKNKVIWHNGANGIFSADLRYYPASDTYYFLAGNSSDGEIFEISDEIHNLVSKR